MKPYIYPIISVFWLLGGCGGSVNNPDAESASANEISDGSDLLESLTTREPPVGNRPAHYLFHSGVISDSARLSS